LFSTLFNSRIQEDEIRQFVQKILLKGGFDFNLTKFGPYRIDISRDGSALVIGSKKGHIAKLNLLEFGLDCNLKEFFDHSDETHFTKIWFSILFFILFKLIYHRSIKKKKTTINYLKLNQIKILSSITLNTRWKIWYMTSNFYMDISFLQ